MVVEDIATILQAGGIGTIGVDLFQHVSPDKPDDLVTVAEYTSDEPQWIQDSETVDVENTRVQVAARSMRPETGRLVAERAYQLLMTVKGQTINGTRYLWCRPADAPGMVGRDENGRFLSVVNFRIAKELSSV